MNKKRIKDMAIGAAVACIIAGVSSTAYAKIASLNIPISYNNIKLIVDRKLIATSEEPFLYNGTTYLPVRTVGEALGKEVTWDGDTKTVYIGSKTETVEESAAAEYSKINPAPIGVSQTVSISGLTGNATVEVTIEGSYRGSEALEMVKKANMFNDDPPSGMEYVVVKIKAYVMSQDKDSYINLGDYNFNPYSGSDDKYAYYHAVAPDPKFSGKLYTGDTLEGYAVYCVDKSDSAPKLAIGEDSGGNGGKWFAI